jgi:hypothetical protein
MPTRRSVRSTKEAPARNNDYVLVDICPVMEPGAGAGKPITWSALNAFEGAAT